MGGLFLDTETSVPKFPGHCCGPWPSPFSLLDRGVPLTWWIVSGYPYQVTVSYGDSSVAPPPEGKVSLLGLTSSPHEQTQVSCLGPGRTSTFLVSTPARLSHAQLLMVRPSSPCFVSRMLPPLLQGQVQSPLSHEARCPGPYALRRCSFSVAFSWLFSLPAPQVVICADDTRGPSWPGPGHSSSCRTRGWDKVILRRR